MQNRFLLYPEADNRDEVQQSKRIRVLVAKQSLIIREFIDTEKRSGRIFFSSFNRDNDDIAGNNSSTDAAVPFSVSRVRWLDERRGCFALCQAKLPRSERRYFTS